MRAPGIDGLEGRRVGIWGTGREGRAIAQLALERGASVTIVQDPPASGVVPTDIRVGSSSLRVHDPSALDAESLDVVVRSPGVSRYRAELERLRASGVDVTTVTAIWLEDFELRPVIAVTGSKGKTMTASLTALALEASGMSVGLGGNIGTPVTDFYAGPAKDAYVIEVSSFQAAEVTVSPPVGVLTLLSPDHLDWHGTYDRYVADKLNLFAHRSNLELAVNARSPEALSAATGIKSTDRLHPYGPSGAVQVSGEDISIEGEAVPALGSLSGVALSGVALSGAALKGRHNLDNLCGAITASRLLTGKWPDFASLASAVSNMPALPCRLETVAICGGLEFVDDTLASNPAGTIAALEVFSGCRVSLIAGGHDRHTDLGALARTVDTFGDIAVVYLGVAGERLMRELAALSSAVTCVPARSVSEGVELAANALAGSPGGAGSGSLGGASSGSLGGAASLGGRGSGVVLFSPAAPTPPSEGTYMERSAEFRRSVRHRVEVRGDGDSAAC